jgi:hypothetical protein
MRVILQAATNETGLLLTRKWTPHYDHDNPVSWCRRRGITVEAP